MRAVLRLLLVLFPVVASAASIDTVVSPDRLTLKPGPPTELSVPATMTVGQFADSLRKLAAQRAESVQPNVSTESGAFAFVLPIVGSAPGAGGTFFRSETTLANNLNRTQNVTLLYFPATTTNCNAGQMKSYQLAPLAVIVWDDLVAQAFQTSGLGSVIVAAVDQFGNPDSTANIDGFSRIWTPIPGFGGSASQSFSAQAVDVRQGPKTAYGLRIDSGFRTNVFIFNYQPNAGARIFDVYVSGINGPSTQFSMTVQQCGLSLTAVPVQNFGVSIITMVPRDGGGAWYGVASSNDNVSSDNWSSTARP